MKAAFGAESIGLAPADERLLTQMRIVREIRRKIRPWCAEIIGVDDRYGFRREFLPAKVDYTHANGRGSRGVWLWWTLTAGHVYQARVRTGWPIDAVADRYLTVNAEGDVVDMTQEEVRVCLASRDSASMS